MPMSDAGTVSIETEGSWLNTMLAGLAPHMSSCLHLSVQGATD